VLAVPRSMDRSFEKIPNRLLSNIGLRSVKVCQKAVIYQRVASGARKTPAYIKKTVNAGCDTWCHGVFLCATFAPLILAE
jgi:hypothetical protein